MNKSLVFALAAAGALLATGAAQAANVQWSVGINVPGLVVTGGPVYREPVPMYAPVPVYREPAQVYAPAPVYAPVPAIYPAEPVYYPRHPEWRHHYRPQAVVVAPRFEPRWERGWQPVVAPRVWVDRDDRHDHRGHHDRD